MFLSLSDVRRVTTRLAAEHDQEVIAVTGTGSDAAYTEVFVRVEGSGTESSRLVIGVNRDVSESSLRESFESQLQSQLQQHDADEDLSQDSRAASVVLRGRCSR